MSRARVIIVALCRWTGLTARGLVALVAAVVTVAGAALALAMISEDVVVRDGLATDDPSVLRLVTDHRAGWLVHTARLVTDLGAAGVLALVAIGAGVFLWMRGAKLSFALSPLVALGLTAVCTAIGKQLVGRARPPLGLRLVNETEPSFPSGHTADSTAVLLALALVVAIALLRSHWARTAIVAASMVVVTAIGASRLELGVHWPTDVLAGWALGIVIAVGVTTAATLVARSGVPSRASSSHPITP
jgi:membrane-associated phospholipid phosphatase